MRFVCIGYLEEEKWSSLSPDQQDDMINKYADYYREIRASGNFIVGYGLSDVSEGIRVSLEDNQTRFSEIIRTSSQLGGMFLLEAIDLEDAKSIIARHPGLILGPFDVRPVDEGLTKAVGA